MSDAIDNGEMSESYDRRMSAVERRVEALYSNQDSAGRALAVHEYRIQRNEAEISNARAEFAVALRDIKAAIEKWPNTLRDELKEQGDARHKRTLQFVSIIIAGITGGGVAANNLIERMMQ